MEKKLASYIQQHQLLNDGDRVLVAASAGVDSTVLCHLFKKLSIEFGVAHCNFRLRGNESDGDELFIKNVATEQAVPFFSASFDTKIYAEKQKVSIQVAARELRYSWLKELMQEHDYPKLATAHHLDDNIETVLFNFAKGTGIKGMRGILPDRGGLIRPLLFATKKEILDYSQTHKITYREDHTNQIDKYTRNKIRQHIIPVFETINPSFQQTAGDTISHLREVEKLYDFAINFWKDQLLEKQQNAPVVWQINIEELLRSPAPATVLFEIIQQFGFNNSQAEQILQSIDNQPGSYFFSPDFRLLIDRSYLIIEDKNGVDQTFQIDGLKGQKIFEIPDGKLIFRKLESIPRPFPKNDNIAFFDASKIKWPLTLRHWTAGDSFKPLGMHGQRKKLQDFFSNSKLSRLEKEKVWILESNGNICWIVGMRLDDRFKVTTETVDCLMVEFLPSTFA